MSPQLAAMYLGLGHGDGTQQEVTAELCSRGWRWDANEGAFLPSPASTTANGVKYTDESASESMTKLVGLVGFLGH